MGKGRHGFWIFTAVSVLLHVAWGVGMPRSDHDASRAAKTQPVELSFSVVEPPPRPEKNEPPPPAVVAKREEPRTPTQPRNRRPLTEPMDETKPTEPTATPVPDEQPSPATSNDAVATAPTMPTPAAPSNAAPGASAIDLSPRMAASTLTAEQLAPPHDTATCNPRISAADGGCRPQNHVLEVQARLNAELAAAAKELPHLVQREPPKLTREADGGYSFKGRVFQARIESDGHVTFVDKPPVGVNAMPFGGTFDLTDATSKGELYPAERRWFLEQTEQLRDQLAQTARVQELARLRRSLEHELDGVLDSASLDAARKRAAVFAIWQDCGEDSDAERTRKIVEAFVRRRMPQGSDMGFSADELAKLNASRSGLRSFAPYSGKSDFGRPG